MNNQNHPQNEQILISSKYLKIMPYQQRIYLLLILYAASVSTMRIPTAYQQGYHSDSDIQESIDNLTSTHPDFVKKTCSQSPNYGYLQIGNPNASHTAYIICNIHAREIITAQICLNWLQNISEQSIPQEYFIRIFYIANSNRQIFIDDQSTCVRKNQNNVDTNRNFPTDFNHLNVDPSSDLYGGEKALDQPLSQCLDGLFTERKPFLFLDLHSGMDKTFFYQEGENNQNELELINGLNKDLFDSSLRVTTLAKDGQTINGHIFGDLKVRLNVQYSFLFQTFMGDYTKGCFYQFNPQGQEKADLITKVSSSITYILEEALSKSILKSPIT